MGVYLMFGSPTPSGRRKRPSADATTAEVAELFGWTPALLRQFIHNGSLPSPLYIDGYPAFSGEYIQGVRANGLCLPGTYPVSPSRWFRCADPIPPDERPKPAKKPRHPLHGKPGPKAGGRKGGAK